jgi:3-hydroxybutyryl-CoA dehydrogenase
MDSFKTGHVVAVVGSGTMGRGIVQILSQSEIVKSVIWKSSNLQRASQALSDLDVVFSKLVSKKRIDAVQAGEQLSKVSIVDSYEALVDCDCIIEAVSENMQSKRAVFEALSGICRPEMILASNTSSLSITELSGLCVFPEKVVGLHFFNPAPVMKLTEVIAGLVTSEATIRWAMDFARGLGKDPVLVNEAPGFIVNRMLIPMINEAIGILAEGVASAEEIDKAMRLGANHPIGPLALADLIGNDVNLCIMETLHDETGDPKYRAHPLLRQMVRANRLGRKSGRGFFQY